MLSKKCEVPKTRKTKICDNIMSAEADCVGCFAGVITVVYGHTLKRWTDPPLMQLSKFTT